MILSFLAAMALANTTVAVMPLGMGAGSDAYDGLGQALAGMVVSDLSHVSGVQLVERANLDALLSEIKLAKSGFLDPRTAQRLGKGVGARLVVTGSYSVVGDTFLLDARVVEVETANLLAAADAQGTIADFVAVEKELVEELVDGLAIKLTSSERRQLMVDAPTERFSALAAWGEGLARRDEGRLDEAKTAFEKALAEDPAFSEARAALDGLAAGLAATKAEQLSAAQSAYQAAAVKVLAAVPPETDRPRDFVDTAETVGAWMLRLGVLEDLGRDCDRYAEMRHYLDRVGFAVKPAPYRQGDRGVASHVASLEAKRYGLDKPNLEPGVPDYRRSAPAYRAAGLFTDTENFILDGQTRFKRTNGMLGSMLGCFDPKSRLKKIDELLVGVRAHGQQAAGKRPTDTLTLEDRLELAWATVQAEHFGASGALQGRVDALLARHRGDERGTRDALAAVDDVLRLAQAWEDHQVRRRGLPEAEVARRMRLLAEGRIADTTLCKPVAGGRQAAMGWLTEYERLSRESSFYLAQHVDSALMTWMAASDFGCLDGVKARVRTTGDGWAYLEAGTSRKLSTGDPAQCDRQWVALDQVLAGNRQWRDDPAISAPTLWGSYSVWSTLVYYRCASE